MNTANSRRSSQLAHSRISGRRTGRTTAQETQAARPARNMFVPCPSTPYANIHVDRSATSYRLFDPVASDPMVSTAPIRTSQLAANDSEPANSQRRIYYFGGGGATKAGSSCAPSVSLNPAHAVILASHHKQLPFSDVVGRRPETLASSARAANDEFAPLILVRQPSPVWHPRSVQPTSPLMQTVPSNAGNNSQLFNQPVEDNTQKRDESLSMSRARRGHVISRNNWMVDEQLDGPEGEDSDSGDESKVLRRAVMRWGGGNGNTMPQNGDVHATFIMPSLPPHPSETSLGFGTHVSDGTWKWYLEPARDIALSLLMTRGVDVQLHYDVVTYHMVPQLLADIEKLKRGSYLTKYNRKGGPPHERFFYLTMLSRSQEYAPEAMLVWKVHQQSRGLFDRVPLADLVGVTWDTNSPAFARHKLYPQRFLMQLRAMRENGATDAEIMEALSQCTEEAFLAGPRISGSNRFRFDSRNAFSLWFLDRRTMTPKSVDVVTASAELCRLWVTALRGLLAINSVCVDEEQQENQAELMRWVREELDNYDKQGSPLFADLV